MISPRRRAFAVIFVVTALLAFTAGGCAGRKKPEPGGSDDRDFSARTAITGALENDRALDENAVNTIQMVISGRYTIDQGLDDFVDINRNLMSLIVDVSAPAKPHNRYLARARSLTAEYLRNRVHQMEACFSAKSGEELEAIYGRPKPELEAARNSIRDLLLKYDPGLEKYIPG